MSSYKTCRTYHAVVEITQLEWKFVYNDLFPPTVFAPQKWQNAERRHHHGGMVVVWHRR